MSNLNVLCASLFTMFTLISCERNSFNLVFCFLFKILFKYFFFFLSIFFKLRRTFLETWGWLLAFTKLMKPMRYGTEVHNNCETLDTWKVTRLSRLLDLDGIVHLVYPWWPISQELKESKVHCRESVACPLWCVAEGCGGLIFMQVQGDISPWLSTPPHEWYIRIQMGLRIHLLSENNTPMKGSMQVMAVVEWSLL